MKYDMLEGAINYIRGRKREAKRYGKNELFDFSVRELLAAIEQNSPLREVCQAALVESVPETYLSEFGMHEPRAVIQEVLKQYSKKNPNSIA